MEVYLINTPASKKIFESSLVYVAGNLSNTLITLLLLPVLTRYLSAYDYGLLATFQAMRSIGNITVRAGTGDAIVRAYYDRDNQGFNFKRYLFNALIVVTGMFSFLFALTLLFSDLIEAKLFFPAAVVFIIPVVSITDAVTNLPLKLWVFEKKPFQYSLFQVSKSLLEILLSLFFVIKMGLLWKGRILGIGIVEAIAMIVSLVFLIRANMLVYTIDYSYIKQILRYGIPIFFHSLGFWIIGSIDRFFINNMVGVSSTGIYSVSYSIAGVIGLFAGSFSMAWTPVFYERLKSSVAKTKDKIVKFTYLYFACMLLIALLLTFITPYILKILVGKEFYGAGKYIFWIAFGSAFQAMYAVVCGYIFYSRKTHLIARITFFVAMVNIALTYCLIKTNGVMGAAQATFLSYLLSFLLTWWFGNKVYPMNWLLIKKSNEYGL